MRVIEELKVYHIGSGRGEYLTVVGIRFFFHKRFSGASWLVAMHSNLFILPQALFVQAPAPERLWLWLMAESAALMSFGPGCQGK
ncbi:hypothetical protein D3C71_98800 [compost metagenome]